MLFPEPEGPRTATTRPGSTLIDSPRSATVSAPPAEKIRNTSSNSTAGADFSASRLGLDVQASDTHRQAKLLIIRQ